MTDAATHDLAALQRQFALGLKGADGTPALALLRPLRGRAPRLPVYRHAYRSRMVAALRANYPVLHRALGDDAFEMLALDYLSQQPSRQPSIRWWGDGLPEWLAALPDDGAPHPALVDLARMEWALGLSFDSADTPPVSADQLAGIAPADWPDLSFVPHPSSCLLALTWAVAPVCHALTADANADTGEPQAQSHTLLIWRAGLDTRWRTLPDDEATLLRACLRGEPVAELCVLAAGQVGESLAAGVAATAFRRWVADGLLCRAP